MNNLGFGKSQNVISFGSHFQQYSSICKIRSQSLKFSERLYLRNQSYLQFHSSSSLHQDNDGKFI